MEAKMILSGVSRRKCNQLPKICAKKEKKASIKKVSLILRKCESQRTEDERILLSNCGDEVAEIESRQARSQRNKDRSQEVEDPQETLLEKCKVLAEAVSTANHLVVYTGAGISTSAHIPDYRGAQGIWTLLQKGKDIGNHDLSQAEPTMTHMALFELHKKGLVKYIVSQNCDGLHLRSGLPKAALSEVHGNMYIEACRKCQPNRQYWRLFDTTELTGRFTHKTRRKCRHCGDALVDSIVHFGERGTLSWPLNWKGAIRHSEKADVILCLGSSLKVLKRYPWLWAMDKPAKKRPKIYIVNLQWTPKDESAILKINGRCDEVMKTLMDDLQMEIPRYERHKDPLFAHATPLHEEEEHTTTQPCLTLDRELAKLENLNLNNVSVENHNLNNVSGENHVKTIIKNDELKAEIKTEVVIDEDRLMTNNVLKENRGNTKDDLLENESIINNVKKEEIDCVTTKVINEYSGNKQLGINKESENILKLAEENINTHNDIIMKIENENPNNKYGTITTISNNVEHIINSPKSCDKKHDISNSSNNLVDNNLTNSIVPNHLLVKKVDEIIENKHDIKKSIIVQGKPEKMENVSPRISPTKLTLFSIDSILSTEKLSGNSETKTIHTWNNVGNDLNKTHEEFLDYSRGQIKMDSFESRSTNKRPKLYDQNLVEMACSENKANIGINRNLFGPKYTSGDLQNYYHMNNIRPFAPHFMLDGFMNPIGQYQPQNFLTNGYYEAIMNYYEAISQSVPQINYSRHAYSGLHSIIPPNESFYFQNNSAYQTLSYNNKLNHHFQSNIQATKVSNIKNNDSTSKLLTTSKNDVECKPKESKEQYITNNAFDISQQAPKSPECTFCRENYKSFICLFYKKEQASFAIKVERKGKIIFCVCCDYSDSSEDEDKNENETNDKIKIKNKLLDDVKSLASDDSDRDSIVDADDEKIDDKSSTKVQAGWFGKGYRKNRRKKRA